MGASIVRQWHVLSILPKPPRRIDTAAIEARLRERGVDVHRRTIQRDLVELSAVFPIVADERAKPYGWRWSADAEFMCQVPAVARDGSAQELEVTLRVRRVAAGVIVERLGGRRARVSESATGALLAEVAEVVDVVVVVDDTCATRRLLLGHADEIEVLAPARLRREIAERARLAVAAHDRRA